MARLISQKGQTANVTIGSPQQGMKWIVKWAIMFLKTGTTTGNRSATLWINRVNNSYSSGAVLAGIGNQSGTSTVYVAGSDVTTGFSAGGNPLGQYNPFYRFPEVYAVDVIQLNVALQSGDTVDYYILVEEASS